MRSSWMFLAVLTLGMTATSGVRAQDEGDYGPGVVVHVKVLEFRSAAEAAKLGINSPNQTAKLQKIDDNGVERVGVDYQKPETFEVTPEFYTDFNKLMSQRQARLLAEPTINLAVGQKKDYSSGGEVQVGTKTGKAEQEQFVFHGTQITVQPTAIDNQEEMKWQIDASFTQVDPRSKPGNPILRGFMLNTDVELLPNQTYLVTAFENDLGEQQPAARSQGRFGQVLQPKQSPQAAVRVFMIRWELAELVDGVATDAVETAPAAKSSTSRNKQSVRPANGGSSRKKTR